MYPYISIGDIELPTYIIIFGVGYVLMTIYACRIGNEYGYCKKDMIGTSVYALVGLVLGAKLLYFATKIPYVFTEMDRFEEMWVYAPMEVIDYLFGGMVYYGGLIGAAIGAYIYTKKAFLVYRPYMEIYAPLVPLVHGFGRIGCFMAGCCYGIEYNGMLAVCCTIDNVCRFPVQLVEAIFNIIIAVVLEIVRRRRIKKWKTMQVGDKENSKPLFGFYLIYYAIIRFILEFLRGDMERGGIWVLSTSQIISIVVLPIGLWILFGRRLKVDRKA